METITTALDDGSGIDVIYLDNAKAFDTVPHRRLITKLHAYGIAGNLLRWIEEFLANRRQKVSVRGTDSKWAEVISGFHKAQFYMYDHYSSSGPVYQRSA